jgi:hypothetical protein
MFDRRLWVIRRSTLIGRVRSPRRERPRSAALGGVSGRSIVDEVFPLI